MKMHVDYEWSKRQLERPDNEDEVLAYAEMRMKLQQKYTVKLASDRTRVMRREDVLHWLKHLHDFYSGQEKDWYAKSEGDAFNIDYEREWLRYADETAALQVAIDALSDEMRLGEKP